MTRSESPSTAPRPRRLLRRVLLAGAVLLGLVLVAAIGAGGWLYAQLRSSLPQLAGEVTVSGLSSPVVVARDALGVPDVVAADRRDAAFATGFLHAQDRFFQMDLLRRRAAGALAELFGPGALAGDAAMRRHRFRQLAAEIPERSSPQVRALLDAYAAGVNAGLAALGEKPFEYLLLRQPPRPWTPEDSILVLLSMFAQLQDGGGYLESHVTMMHDLLPAELFAFLMAPGTEWDTPLVGPPFATPPIPGPEVLDLRADRAAATAAEAGGRTRVAGSNAWAVAGDQALLANELHLRLSVPNIWYRASLSWPDHRVTGATLPGLPVFVVGSNGHVAWGVTNSLVDANDVVLLEEASGDGAAYLTPDGPQPFERHTEVIRVRGGEDRQIEVEWTRWGPVLEADHRGRRRALRWVAHEVEAVNLDLVGLETTTGLDAALAVVHRSGVPALNVLLADAAGRIAWTVFGRIPRRIGCDGRLARSWADGSCRWQGLLPPAEVPVVTDPPSGRLWAANNRLVDGEMLALLGDDGYLLGARARQIRDGLMALERPTVDDMRRLQLDDRARLLERWQKLLLEVLTPGALAGDPRRGELRRRVAEWGGHAAVDSQGYPLVREFRSVVGRDLFAALTAPCREIEPDFDLRRIHHRFEGPLWQLVSHRPLHLLDPRYASWEEFFLAKVDEVVERYSWQGALGDATWGTRNTVRMRHPLSGALPPVVGSRLNMPPQVLPGDEYVPRVQHPEYGATLRMVVSPGREAEGFFHMPGGQSGHPLSPHYADSHAAWAAGEATPFLPGAPVHTLELRSEGGGPR